MRKKILLLGSTGSIGRSSLNIIRNYKSKLEIVALSTNKNIRLIIKQSIEFKVKNLIINDFESYKKVLQYGLNKKIRIFNNISDFLKNNKKKLISFLCILILVPFSYFSYQIYNEKNKEKISSKYNQAIINFENSNKLELKSIMQEIIISKDSTYSPLALYFLIDNNIEVSNEDINKYFDIIINEINLDNEIKNLNIYKKGLFNSSFASENELLSILKPVISSDSLWKPHALILLGEYFLDKNQNQKAKEFFNQILNIDNANEILKIEAKQRLISIGG